MTEEKKQTITIFRTHKHIIWVRHIRLHFSTLIYCGKTDALQMNLYFTQYVLCTFGILCFLSLVFFRHRNIILDMFVDICKSNNAIMFSLWQERDD